VKPRSYCAARDRLGWRSSPMTRTPLRRKRDRIVDDRRRRERESTMCVLNPLTRVSTAHAGVDWRKTGAHRRRVSESHGTKLNGERPLHTREVRGSIPRAPIAQPGRCGGSCGTTRLAMVSRLVSAAAACRSTRAPSARHCKACRRGWRERGSDAAGRRTSGIGGSNTGRC
jgi:hypothetical protein